MSGWAPILPVMDKDTLLELIDAYAEERALVAANEALERTGYFVTIDVRDRDAAYAKMVAYIEEHA